MASWRAAWPARPKWTRCLTRRFAPFVEVVHLAGPVLGALLLGPVERAPSLGASKQWTLHTTDSLLPFGLSCAVVVRRAPSAREPKVNLVVQPVIHASRKIFEGPDE